MCIVALAWKVLEQTPMLMLSNRDEFYQRPSQALAYWPEQQCYAGRDLQAGGTWMAVNAQGRWAVLTNYRELSDRQHYAQSRGELVPAFLNSALPPIRFAQQLEQRQCDYAGFNLLIGDRQQAVYCSNRGAAPHILPNGIYVLSNGLMHEHWHKCAHLRQRFSQEFLALMQLKPPQALAQLDPAVIALAWDLLEDRRKLATALLPDTGVGLAQEQLLSATFIESPDYGTRCSNLVLLSAHELLWLEKIQQGQLRQQIQHLQLRFAENSASMLRYSP
jgi:uncharacterized protein with NRDE domain